MRIKMQWKWKRLDETTYRTKIIGGWLVLHRQPSKPELMQFVTDKNNEWKIVPPIHEE